MAKSVDRLTTKKIEAFARPGYYHDGHGLYLQVLATGGRSWLFRYMEIGRAHV